MKTGFKLTGVVSAVALSLLAAKGTRAAETAAEWDWIDGTKLPIEGKAFADTAHYYDRLPACWSNEYTASVWSLQRDSAGLAFRFVTDAERIRVRWSLTSPSLAMAHMPATGESGVDVYQYGCDSAHGAIRDIGRWNYCKPPFPTSLPRGQFSNEYEVAVRPGVVTMVYLPTYNGISEFTLGLPKGKTVKAAPPRASGVTKPVVFYGTSTTQGGCTSRPSTAWPSIVGMEADVPIVNLGFSGSGRMEDIMVDVLARIDASLYVLDTIGNMGAKQIDEKYERFVRRLREKRPGVPIMMTVNTWCDEWNDRNEAIRRVYRKIKSSDPDLWKDLSLAGEGEAFGADRNYAVEGVHLNDWGAWHVGRGFAEAVRQVLFADRADVPAGLVTWKTLDRYCKTNARELKGPVKGIVVEHPWLGQQSMDYCTKYVMDRATREGVVYMHVWAHPWSWMNNEQVKLTDRLVDVVSDHFGLGPDAKVVSYGISMGGHGALAYPQFSRKNVVAAVANCPPCDLEYHYTERPDLPRTLVAAYADEPDFAAALRRHSPLATVEAFKDIPYFIYQGDADKAVNKERHGDRFVAAAAKRAKGPLKVAYVIGRGRGHAQIEDPERQQLEDAIFAPLTAGAASQKVSPMRVDIDATQPGRVMPNTSQVLTFWNGVRNSDGTPFEWPGDTGTLRTYPVRGFVRYAELMAATGGNRTRDLFRNPDDRTVLDDYDFAPLVNACRGIRSQGYRPYLKLGNVPAKFSADYDGGEFSMNIRPPTDDLVHYRYMKACAAALRAAFGRDEVRQWRFAVLTEADNTGWFQAKSKSKDEIREAFFRLYDYAERAFEEELGPGLVFGTHLLYPGDPNCPQTQFSVEEFARHCACGTNSATGGIGAPLRLLTASYYGVPDRDDLSQGRCVNLRRLRAAIDKYGLRDVVTGVDEGRVIVSRTGRERRDLLSRAVGASYQAAFDVRAMKEIFDDGMDYFASWGYFSGPRIHFEGVPSHHYFSSRELARFEGLRRVPARVEGARPAHEELDAIAGVAADGSSVRAVVGRFRDKLVFTNRLETTVSFRLPKAWAGRKVRVSVLTLDDRNNWYCDWERDRQALGIAAGDYDWSPDDFAVLASKGLRPEKFRREFSEKLQPKYARRAEGVREVRSTASVASDATLTLPLDFVGNGAAFVALSEQ